MKRLILLKIVWVLCYLFLFMVGEKLVRHELSLDGVPSWGDVKEDIPLISSRGSFRNGVLSVHHDRFDYSTLGDIPGLTPGTEPPDDLMIIIHGFNNNEFIASSVCDLARDSLMENDFNGEVVGFCWDADTQLDPNKMIGYHEARLHAEGNGTKLARFILDYKTVCPDTRIHLLGYSMGTRIAVETLYALEYDEAFMDLPVLIESVHMVGASIHSHEVQTNERYGNAIENRVESFFIYYSEEDKVLGFLWRMKEGGHALGREDIKDEEFAPVNYYSIDAKAELKVLDSEGNIDTSRTGDNHLGCLGLKNADGVRVDDGVMNLVAEAIRSLVE